MVGRRVGQLIPPSGVPTDACICPSAVGRGSSCIAAAGPWTPLGLSLMFPSSLVGFRLVVLLPLPLLLGLRMGSVLRGRRPRGLRRVSVGSAHFVLLYAAATPTAIVPSSCISLTLRWEVMQSRLATAILPG